MQVLFGAMLIGATHAALEDRKVAFDGVGMHVAANVFLAGMLDGLMVCKVRRHAGIEAAFVGIEDALAGNVVGNESGNVFLGRAGNMEGANRTVPLNQADHGALV